MKQKVGKSLVLVMGLGTFVVVLDNTIMNVSISALVEDLNTTVSGVQAAIALNALMMAAFVLMGGKLADIIGAKKTFLMGAVLYITGSLLASMSNNLLVFILGWCAIQGFGAAMMLPNVSTIIRANIEGPARAQAYGMMAGINAIATATGPIIGGFLTTYFSWRWAFRLEVFVLLFVLLMSKTIPKDALIKVKPMLDKIGIAWQAGAMMLLVTGTLLISDYGIFLAKQPFVIFGYEFDFFGLSIVPILWALGILCLFMFVRWENKLAAEKKNALVDLRLFSIFHFVRGLNVRFIQVALMAGTTFAVPLYLQVTYGMSAFETGFVLLGFTFGLIITALGGAKKGLHILPKKKIEWGFVISIIGVICMAVAVYYELGSRSIIPGLFIYGLGFGLVASQIVDLIMSSISAKQTAEGSGITSTFETLGSAVGTAIVGTVLVVALTTGIGNMVEESTVFPPELKSEITSQMSTSVDVVSTEALSGQIAENGIYEEEAVRIYDAARKNAFIISLLFMAFMATVALLLSRGLPSKKVTEAIEVV